MQPNPLARRVQLIRWLVPSLLFALVPPVRLGAQAPNPENPPMITLTPYLLLDGTCQPAMQFYHACLGGELTLTLVGDSPLKAMFPATMHHKVLNARLVSAGVTVSASDWLRPQQTPVPGNTVCLYLSGGSYAELKAAFDRLADGANVTDPLKEEAFGTYGALTDKFGIRWMFHADRASP
jgi:PhnB protein